jgi:hypothetical protein
MVFFHLEKAGVNLSDGWNANGNERHKPHVVATLAIDENAFCDCENGRRATCRGTKAQVAEATTTDKPTSYQQRHLPSRTPTRRPGIVGSNNRRNVQHSGWRVGVVAAEDCEPLNNREGLGDRLGEPSADIEENVV